jgi:2-oxopent-4-enoate/cis-2-oxohex-4-enoate hydratase
MDEALIHRLGDELFAALRACSTVEPLSTRYPDIQVEDAYQISLHMLQRRLADGEHVIGKKIGVTSKVVQEMLGVFQPDFGFLTSTMQVANGHKIT